MAAKRQPIELSDTFRFMVICREIKEDKKWNEVHLKDVFSTVVERGGFPCGLPVTVAIGLMALQEHEGKSLGLTLWQLAADKTRKPLEIRRIDGPEQNEFLQVVLPPNLGPKILPVKCRLLLPSPGNFGVDLIDRDGVFGEKTRRIATYLFEVRAE